MNNLYRELAPVTEEAWAEIELEATRTFKRHIAGRRVVDVSEPGGPAAAAVSTGRLLDVKAPTDGVVHICVPANRLCGSGCRSHCRAARSTTWSAGPRTPIGIRSRRRQEAGVRRGPHHLRGYAAASIEGIRAASSNRRSHCPRTPAHSRRDHPGVSELRLAGVDGPYSVLLSADVYTKVSETTEHGYPIREHSIGWSTATSSGRPPSTAPSC